MRKRKVVQQNEDELLLIKEEEPEEKIEETKSTPKFKVKINCPQLRRRRAPNLQAEVVNIINDWGIYDIYDEVNGWGKLEDGNWIMLSYT